MQSLCRPRNRIVSTGDGIVRSDSRVSEPPATAVSAQDDALAFLGKIIYAGLVEGYNVLIGPGISGELKQLYNRLKQREWSIEQLVNAEGIPQRASAQKRATKPAPDCTAALADIVTTTAKMRKAHTPTQTAALSLLRAAAHVAESSYVEPVMMSPLRLPRQEQRRHSRIAADGDEPFSALRLA